MTLRVGSDQQADASGEAHTTGPTVHERCGKKGMAPMGESKKQHSATPASATRRVRIAQYFARARAEQLLRAIKPYRGEITVSVECTYPWYWVADLCHEQKIPFALGHALYMKAIHGAKVKNDRIDSQKIARLTAGVPGVGVS